MKNTWFLCSNRSYNIRNELKGPCAVKFVQIYDYSMNAPQ